MKIREEIYKSLVSALYSFIGSNQLLNFSLEVPENSEHGDYATNAAMVLAKILKKNPLDIADELSEKIIDERWTVSVVPPGFVNITISNRILLQELRNVLNRPETWGRSDKGNGKTVMVEYFQLNIAKRPHIGHLRSAVIGDALKRIFISQGYRAVSDTHVGDWGTQFGILLYEWKVELQKNSKLEEETKQDPFNKLEELYKKGSSYLENLRKTTIISRKSDKEHLERFKDEDIKKVSETYIHEYDLRKREFAKLEQGDAENRKIWEWMVGVSMKKLKESAQFLELLPFDEHKGESSYEADMPIIAEEALEKGIAVKKEYSAVTADLTKEKLGEAVLIKSDGASTYLLRDLATIKYRKEQWNFWKNLYLVDVRQSYHFRQIFCVAELLGYEGVGESEHVEFGFMKLPEGAMSTRKGTAIALDILLEEAEKQASNIIKEKNPNLAKKDEIIRQVSLGAIKYFDLSHNRTSDIIFTWEKALSFEGNTGPYLQYTHARLKSILRKINSFSVEISDTQNLAASERRVLVALLRFPEVIENALEALSPHILAGYLYEFASITNEFYHAYPVIQEEDKQKQVQRITLVIAAALTLKKGLNLLGIEAPEEM